MSSDLFYKQFTAQIVIINWHGVNEKLWVVVVVVVGGLGGRDDHLD